MLAAPKGLWGLLVEATGWQLFPLERKVIRSDDGRRTTEDG